MVTTTKTQRQTLVAGHNPIAVEAAIIPPTPGIQPARQDAVAIDTMIQRATSVPIRAPSRPARTDDALDDALQRIAARATAACGAAAAAGTLVDHRIERIQGDPAAIAPFTGAFGDAVGDPPDGPFSPSPVEPGGWTAFRYQLGDRRAAGLLVTAEGLDPLVSARLEVLALDAVRAALLHEERVRTGQLDRLLATARQVAESLELETVLSSIVRDASTLLGADSGDMLLWDREQDVLRVVAVSNFPPEMLGFELRFGEGVSTQAILAGRTIEVPDYRTYEHRAPALDAYDFGAVLCAPLVVRGVGIGAINLHARAGRRGFPAGAADLLAAFAGHAAIAIDHARRYENEVRLGRALAETNRELSRSLTVQQHLAEQVLLGAGLGGIAGVLAEHLGREVAILDDLHRLIAGAAPDAGDGWRELLAESEPSNRAGRSGREAFAIAIRVGSDVVGHLLLSSDADLGPIDRALVDVATTGVALEFARERAAAEVEERLRGEAVIDLLTGSYSSDEAIGARAARLGHDLGLPHDLIVIDVASAVEPPPGDGDADRLRRAFQATRDRLAQRTPRSLAAQHLGSIVVLAGVPVRGDADPRSLANELRTALEAAIGPGCITIAIGERCERPAAYGPAFRQARDVVDLMIGLGRGGAVVAAHELGTYWLLLRASTRSDLEAFATRTLDPLVRHDRAHSGELVATLRAYLEEDRVQRRVAARCFIHVNTVVYRVRRIEELLGVDLDDPATVFDLTLALRINDLLAGPVGGTTPDARRT